MKTRLSRMFVVVALLCAAFSLSACGGDTSSPANAVKAYHEALKAKDKERMKKVLSKEDVKNMKDDAEVKSDGDTEGEYTVGAATEDGDKAKVPVTYKKDGKESKVTYHCVKEDGEWKVALGVTFVEAFKEALGGKTE